MQHYTIVLGLNDGVDAMALVAPLMLKGRVVSIEGKQGDMIAKRDDFIAEFNNTWNNLPGELRKHKDMRALLDLVIGL